MAITTTPPGRRISRTVADAAGLERLLWQRVAPDGRHSVVAGIRRRRPAYVTVGGETASRLRAAGLPTILTAPTSGSDR